MHDARGVANYFLKRAEERGMAITVMTLLKVLYFAHAWHLVKYGEALVGQPFEAWRHGPVNRVVYDQLKRHGAQPVQERLKAFDAGVCGFVDASSSLAPDTCTFLNNIFDYYAEFNAFHLSELTHEKGSPWDVIWQAAETGAVPGMIIPDSLILEWFRGSSARMAKTQ